MPEAVSGVQVNACRNTLCTQFGLPPRVVSKNANQDRVEGFQRIGGVGLRGLRCTTCQASLLIKSNQAVADELSRIRAYLDDPAVACANEACASHEADATPRFQRFGRTRSGSPRMRCVTCGKTQSFPSNPVWRQRAADKNVQILRVLINKAPMRRLLETTEISAQTLYRKLAFFEQQCFGFAAERERTLAEKAFTHVDLATDRQDYLVNWGRHVNRRSFALRVVATAEARSGYVLGVHSNFDDSIGIVEAEHQARNCGDVEKEAYERRFARVWLLSDYAQAARVKQERGRRAGRDQTQYQPMRPTEAVFLDPFAEDYEQAAPARGVQVRQEYVLFAHFLLLRSLLAGAKHVAFFLDLDPGLSSAAMTAFGERVRSMEVDVFSVRSQKGLTVDQRDASISRSTQLFARFMEKHPDTTRHKAAVAWLTELMELTLAEGKAPTSWMPHPFSDRAEPGKEFRLESPRPNDDPARLARAATGASLRSVDRFFMRVRRRFSLLERPLHSVANAARACYIYAPYNPAVACRVLNIFRVLHNYHLAGDQDKATPAMRLGLADRAYRLEEILAVPRPSRLIRQGTHTSLTR